MKDTTLKIVEGLTSVDSENSIALRGVSNGGRKRRFSITNLFRRSPKPADRKVFNMGIQERETNT